jgi:hypothetical protein
VTRVAFQIHEGLPASGDITHGKKEITRGNNRGLFFLLSTGTRDDREDSDDSKRGDSGPDFLHEGHSPLYVPRTPDWFLYPALLLATIRT